MLVLTIMGISSPEIVPAETDRNVECSKLEKSAGVNHVKTLKEPAKIMTGFV